MAANQAPPMDVAGVARPLEDAPPVGAPAGGLRVRQKLTLVSVLAICLVSFAFTGLTLSLSRIWIEDDLRERAIAFAREIAATIGDRSEFENVALLGEQIRQILNIRQNVAQLEILAFTQHGARLVATSDPASRLPFTRREAARAERGDVLSRLVETGEERYWEVMAPVSIGGKVAGAVAAKFSLDRADRLAARTRWWALVMTGASVLAMALCMTLAVRYVVDRPIRHLMEAISRIAGGEPRAFVPIETRDEFGVLAGHFNALVAQIHRFNEDLHLRIAEATAELDQRYRELRRLNERLFDTQRRLGQAERLAVAGRLMAEVAHEVGTPLHSVAGHLELVRRELAESMIVPAVADRLTIIESQLRRVTDIIGRFLEETRRVVTTDAVALGALVEETLMLIRPGAAAKDLQITFAAASPDRTVRGDRSQLQQVVLNLLTNAIDATARGGRIEVSVREGTSAGELMVEVRDTGTGIPEASRQAIFEPFFSTKAPGRGTGLGLFVSEQIVRDHRGRIEVESREGEGATFRVVLPATEAGT